MFFSSFLFSFIQFLSSRGRLFGGAPKAHGRKIQMKALDEPFSLSLSFSFSSPPYVCLVRAVPHRRHRAREQGERIISLRAADLSLDPLKGRVTPAKRARATSGFCVFSPRTSTRRHFVIITTTRPLRRTSALFICCYCKRAPKAV